VNRRLVGAPVWVWVLLAASAVAVGVYVRRRQVATTQPVQAPGFHYFDTMTASLAGGSVARAPHGIDPVLFTGSPSAPNTTPAIVRS
jgi:hypothetical protein